ncbi:P-II family nitrogen regulator [Thermus thermamylovorans]|uniref:Transcriptional regulator n=1 Tax=Thermus thermamylovorans TaxID=2509362 RepID=A0A4Q9B6R5_9DEIN|nr:transcriptional regulator [Thermus thermamylovorans]TBH21407.1 transcriptional regulator [Thermus thermamylovorans]
MDLVPLKLVTIVAESVLEKKLVEEVKRLGAKGYTVVPARGEGSRGMRSIDWEGQNIRLETIVPEEVALRILARLQEAYFPHYAVIAYVENVWVVRGEKYV